MHNESNSARKGIGMTYETLPHWFSGSPLTHTVARDIMQYGPIARTAIAQMHGLSQGTVSRITSDLMHWGVIRETGAATGTGEARSQPAGCRTDSSQSSARGSVDDPRPHWRSCRTGMCSQA